MALQTGYNWNASNPMDMFTNASGAGAPITLPQGTNPSAGVYGADALNNAGVITNTDIGIGNAQTGIADFFGGITGSSTASGNAFGLDSPFFDTKNQQGWGGTALAGLGALGQSWLGFQNVGIAKDRLNFQRDAFNKQFDEQKRLQDQYRADRQASRDAAFQ